jgi:apolipoprotein N-acyltransferase
VIPVLFFPWVLLGHTLAAETHLKQGADLLGVYGLSFIIAGVNACLAFAIPALLPARWSRFRQRCQTPQCGDIKIKSAWKITWLFLLVGVGGAWCYGELRIEKMTPRLKEGDVIAVIQGNIFNKLDRTDEQYDAQLRRHIELHHQIVTHSRSIGTPAVLVCWAETMIPGTYNQGSWSRQFIEQVRTSGMMTLAGSVYEKPASQASSGGESQSQSESKWGADILSYNAAMVFDEKGQNIHRYFKRRLVPFGEYIPYADRFPLMRVLRSVTRDQFLPGTEPSPIFKAGNYHIGLNLCVEDVHPDLAREAANAGADAIINLTNDGWFYGTFGPMAHMRAAVWRSVEVRRPMLRVTNTGRTVAIDPLGETTLLVPHETEGTALVRLNRIAPEDNNANVNGAVTLYMMLGERGVFFLMGLILLACWVFRLNQTSSVEIKESLNINVVKLS